MNIHIFHHYFWSCLLFPFIFFLLWQIFILSLGRNFDFFVFILLLFINPKKQQCSISTHMLYLSIHSFIRLSYYTCVPMFLQLNINVQGTSQLYIFCILIAAPLSPAPLYLGLFLFFVSFLPVFFHFFFLLISNKYIVKVFTCCLV